jgi:hypothetical protein
MKMTVAGLIVAALAVGGVVFALNSSDDDVSISSNPESTQATVEKLPLNLQVDLEPLMQGIYEGWVMQGDAKLSFGTFNTNEAGDIVGDLDLGSIAAKEGDTVAISIEPENDTDPSPSATIVLAGEIQNGRATLAFPLDVSGFSGQYILATPSTETTDDETAGLWFTITGVEASLDIPVAPAGWAYEGWVVVDGTPISTGLFTDPASADLFAGFTGPGMVPNKPGEDFISNLPNGLTGPLDLKGRTIVLSIEPFQDGVDPTGPMPSQTKPLTAMVAAGATDHFAYDLVLGLDSVPSGSARL